MSDKQLTFKRKELALPCFSDLDADFIAFNVELSTNATATYICCMSDTAQFIQGNWEKVVHQVNYDYITTDISTFERWNIYLVFASKEQLDTETQYKLENDKYAMRKLYLKLPDDLQPNQSEQVISNLLSKKLLLDGLSVQVQENILDVFPIGESSVSRSVWDAELSSSRSDKEIEKRKSWLQEELDRRVDNED